MPKNETLTLELRTLVEDKRPVYLVGNFNQWQAEEEKYKMKKIGKGRYTYTFATRPKLPQPLEYKYLKGAWENQELNDFGVIPTNRRLDYNKGTVRDFVPRWNSYGLSYNPKYRPIIETVSDNFQMPQMGRTRRVRVLLPHDYHTSGKSYPVIYLQDAQNLWEVGPFGTWGIDKKMALLAERGKGDLIIVAIDHAGTERINEYMPISTKRWGVGDGRKYVRFVAETLKKYVDTQYRTKPDRLHTGIGGSSMGGLISIYAGLMKPEIFGKLLIFSPSLWITQNVSFDTIKFFNPIPTRIYVYAGGKEGSGMVPNVKRFRESIQKQGFDNANVQIKLAIDPKGQHTEGKWGTEFPKAIEWLFFT